MTDVKALAYASKLYNLADQIIKAVAADEDYLPLVAEAEETVQSLFMDEFDYEIIPADAQVLTSLPEGHSFVLYKKDHVDQDNSTFMKQTLCGFMESYATLDEAYDAAKARTDLPIYVGEATEEDGAIHSKMMYIYTDKAVRDQFTQI